MKLQCRGSPLPSRLAYALLCSSAGLLATPRAVAQTATEPAARRGESERASTARDALVLGVRGAFDAHARATLVELLRAELDARKMVLVERDPSDEPRAWARDVARDERHLLAVLLDTEDPGGWRLVLIDTARGRAISRQLPAGERDAANVEAIVSIVLSATNALREGLEVASAPIETVIEAGPAPTEEAPVHEGTHERHVAPARTALHASLAGVVASFSNGAEPTFGASLGVGVSIASALDLDLGGARFLPVTVSDDLGSFSLGRTTFTFSGGPLLRIGAIALVPAVGATSEWIVRRDTQAAAGVAPGDDAHTIQRWGGVLTLRGRYRLLSSGDAELVSLTTALSAAYFGQRVRFLAGTDTMAEVRRSVLGAELGLFVTTDPR